MLWLKPLFQTGTRACTGVTRSRRAWVSTPDMPESSIGVVCVKYRGWQWYLKTVQSFHVPTIHGCTSSDFFWWHAVAVSVVSFG